MQTRMIMEQLLKESHRRTEHQLTPHSRIGGQAPSVRRIFFGEVGAADNLLRRFVNARTLSEIPLKAKTNNQQTKFSL